jgi:hypothetical protein
MPNIGGYMNFEIVLQQFARIFDDILREICLLSARAYLLQI